METIAVVKAIGLDIEEEVTLKVNNIELVGFVGYSPYPIEEGRTYTVEISITVFDELNIKELLLPAQEFIRINDGFSYIVRGKLLEEGKLDAGIVIEDELFTEYSYLYNKYVEIVIDRLNIEFLE